MRRLHLTAAAFLLFFISFIELPAQQAVNLPRSVPEAEGVSSQAIIDFLDAAGKSKNEFHSFMLLRHGKVIAEGWWNPYRPELKHTLYSCSKSFTATAVGFAIEEKKLKLSDKVISFFPNDLPDSVSSNLAALTVKDALIMSDGQAPDPSFAVASKQPNWIKGFLATPVIHQPGSEFLYNSLGTYMLSAIVQKVTGQTVLDYLKPRLFDPLGIEGMDWETDLQGINTGGWGLRIRTEDMAKFAQLFLQKGKWNGKQILSKSWVEDASTMKIMQDPGAPQSKKDSSDWLQGYCYQMWRSRHNSFRGDGAFGQFMIVMPEQDAVVVITAETPDMQNEINLVWDYLLPAFQKGKLPANAVAVEKLKQKISNLALPRPELSEIISDSMTRRSYSAASNPQGIAGVSLSFSGQTCTAIFKTDSASYTIAFGAGKWLAAETAMPGPSLTSGRFSNTSMLLPAKIAAAYTWKDAHTLELVIRYIESPHTETFVCHFDEGKATMDVIRSLDFGRTRTVVQLTVNN